MDNKKSNFIYSTDSDDERFNIDCKFIILLIVIIFIIAFWINSNYKIKLFESENSSVNSSDKLEHMTGGTVTQMFANDSQDVYTKTGIRNDATGNFNLFWNQPTRITGTYPNRGQLLPSIILPQVAAIQNGNDPDSIDIPLQNPNEQASYSEDLAKLKQEYSKELEQNNTFLQTNCGEKCYTNPAACGNGPGGYRLGSDFVEASKSRPFITLQGNVYYPDQYTGEYWIQPVPDIMKPLPVVANGLPPLPF